MCVCVCVFTYTVRDVLLKVFNRINFDGRPQTKNRTRKSCAKEKYSYLMLYLLYILLSLATDVYSTFCESLDFSFTNENRIIVQNITEFR